MSRIAELAHAVFKGRTSFGAVLQTSVANIFIQAAYIGSGIITARALGPAGRGALAAMIMWPQFLSYLCTLGIPVSSVYHVRKHPENGSSITAAAISISLGMGLIASVIGFFVIPYPLHTYPATVVHFARWAILVAPLALLGITLSTLAQSAGAFRRYNFVRVTQPLAVLAVLAVAWCTRSLTPYSAALAYLLAGIPIMMWNLVWVWRHFRPAFAGGQQAIRDLVNYGVRVWGGDLFGTVANQVDRVLLVSMLSPKQMGLYIVSQSVTGLMNVVPAAICTVLMPKAADRSTSEIVDLTGKATRLTVLVLIVLGIPLFVAGGYVLTMMYGHKYDGATMILRVLVVEAVLDGATGVLSQAFLASGIPGTVSLLQASGLLFAFPLMYWMIPRWGLVGAASALLISTAIRLTFILANFPLRLKTRPPRFMPTIGDLTLLRNAW